MSWTVLDVWMGRNDAWRPWMKQALFFRAPSRREFSLADTELDPDEEEAVARSEVPTWMQRDLSWLGEKRSPPSRIVPLRGSSPSGDREARRSASKRVALIVDLPGAEAIRMGLALGQRGFRPVFAMNTTSFPGEVISMKFVLRWLRKGALYRSAFIPRPDAPPVFLLDSRREGGRRKPSPGSFDNRWTLFASDLPSAERLRARGIDSVTIIQEGVELLADLAAIAGAYRRVGLEVRVADVESETLSELTAEPPGRLGFVLDQVARWWNLPRTYGRIVRDPSHG